MAKLYGRWGAYEARTPEEKARARRQQAKRAAENAAAQSWKEKHRWCVNGCGKEAAWYPGGTTLLHDGACSAECLAEIERAIAGEIACGHCGGTGRMVRDPDIGTDQECFVCEGRGTVPK